MSANETDGDKIQLLMRNARQILKIVGATFTDISFEGDAPSHECHKSTAGIDELACAWIAIVQGLAKVESGDLKSEAWLLAVMKVDQTFVNHYRKLMICSG